MVNGGSMHWARKLELLEDELVNTRNMVYSLQINYNVLSAQVLAVLEESVQQKQNIHQLQHKCWTLRQHLEELCIKHQQNLTPPIDNGIPGNSQEASSPVGAPVHLDLNAPTSNSG
jgi:hypothetical protein